MPWILEHPCDLWLWDVPNIEALAAQPRTAWALADLCVFGLQYRKNERYFWLGMRTAETCTSLLAGLLGQLDVAVSQDKNMAIRKLPHHAQSFVHQVTTPAHPSCLSRLPWL